VAVTLAGHDPALVYQISKEFKLPADEAVILCYACSHNAIGGIEGIQKAALRAAVRFMPTLDVSLIADIKFIKKVVRRHPELLTPSTNAC
jgi:hypothetical protein